MSNMRSTEQAGIQVKSWSSEDAERDVKSARGPSDFVKTAVRPDPYTFRILPALAHEVLNTFVVVFGHVVQLPGGGFYSCNCPHAMERRACPICNKSRQLSQTGNQADEEVSRALSAKPQVYCNVLDYENLEEGPKIWRFGKMVFDAIGFLRRNPAWGDMTDPSTGYSLSVQVTQQGPKAMNVKYAVTPNPDKGPLPNMDVLTLKHDLARFTKVPTEQEILDGLRGIRPQRGQQGGAGQMQNQARGQLTQMAGAPVQPRQPSLPATQPPRTLTPEGNNDFGVPDFASGDGGEDLPF